MGLIVWGPDVAEAYDDVYAAMFAPAALDPVVELLASLARGGPALEFAAGSAPSPAPIASPSPSAI